MKYASASHKSLYISLVISASLAVGYVAGRFHGEAPGGSHDFDRAMSVIAPDEAHGNANAPNRTRLNPKNQAAAPQTSAASSKSIARYPAARAERVSAAETRATPRNIGEYRDPDALYQDPVDRPQHIGEFKDPEAEWYSADPGPRVAIGHFSDPDSQNEGGP